MAMSMRTRGPGGSITRPRISVRPLYNDFKPLVETKEDPEAHTIYIHLPGFSKDQIKIVAESNKGVLRVRGERLLEGNSWSRFLEEVHVPDTCDITETRAKFEAGVLRVTMPKITSPSTPDDTSTPERSPPKPVSHPHPYPAPLVLAPPSATAIPPPGAPILQALPTPVSLPHSYPALPTPVVGPPMPREEAKPRPPPMPTPVSLPTPVSRPRPTTDVPPPLWREEAKPRPPPMPRKDERPKSDADWNPMPVKPSTAVPPPLWQEEAKPRPPPMPLKDERPKSDANWNPMPVKPSPAGMQQALPTPVSHPHPYPAAPTPVSRPHPILAPPAATAIPSPPSVPAKPQEEAKPSQEGMQQVPPQPKKWKAEAEAPVIAEAGSSRGHDSLKQPEPATRKRPMTGEKFGAEAGPPKDYESLKKGKGMQMETRRKGEDRQVLVNIGAAVMVIVGLGAWISSSCHLQSVLDHFCLIITSKHSFCLSSTFYTQWRSIFYVKRLISVSALSQSLSFPYFSASLAM